ncbi:hypothetical protein Ldro_1449 [Legionella drozanskii LLAP-1]|uniref:Transmembrane protein n=1 Tax=Legionella drozanskii LLAP-1 TaxID=1212489 RepID=A0A0W0SWW2_9GAMM|nr:hypothetical protein Ldro_1449 [Legionella drozanskii LLAP-1]
MKKLIIGFFLYTFQLSIIKACPICLSGTGKEVHRGIFNQDFFYNLLLTALPFFIFLLIAFLLYHGVFIKNYLFRD